MTWNPEEFWKLAREKVETEMLEMPAGARRDGEGWLAQSGGPGRQAGETSWGVWHSPSGGRVASGVRRTNSGTSRCGFESQLCPLLGVAL